MEPSQLEPDVIGNDDIGLSELAMVSAFKLPQ